MRTLRLAVVVGSSALLLSPGALAEEPGDKEQEYVESIFFEEVLPAEVGEYEGRLSVESTRRRMEGSRSAASIYAFPCAQAFFGLIGLIEAAAAYRLASQIQYQF